jgi:hypothetical protein
VPAESQAPTLPSYLQFPWRRSSCKFAFTFRSLDDPSAPPFRLPFFPCYPSLLPSVSWSLLDLPFGTNDLHSPRSLPGCQAVAELPSLVPSASTEWDLGSLRSRLAQPCLALPGLWYLLVHWGKVGGGAETGKQAVAF